LRTYQGLEHNCQSLQDQIFEADFLKNIFQIEIHLILGFFFYLF